MKQTLKIAILLPAMVLCFPGCRGGKVEKKTARDNPAAVTEDRRPGAAAKAVPPGSVAPDAHPASASHAANRKTPEKLIESLPCRLDGKRGVFAVFPDNPVSGQVCFSLYPARGKAADIPTFDIRAGGMYIIFHDTAGITTGPVTLMNWENRGGRPCLDAACGKKIAVKRETYNAPGNAGWTYTIISPVEAVGMSSVNAGYYGVVMNGGAQYLPLFY